MRWQSAQRNQERIRSGFLWLPKMAWWQHWRWLERGTWLERYNGYSWQVVEWIDADDDESPRFALTDAGKAHLEGLK